MIRDKMESKEGQSEIVAGDIVILPHDEITEEAISLNRRILDAPFRLSGTDFLPHITLAMAYMDLKGVFSEVERMAGQSRPFNIVLDRVSYKDMDPAWGGGKYQSSWDVEESGDLLDLHQRLVRDLPRIDFSGRTGQLFVDEDQVSQTVVEYVRDFRSKHSGKNYWPHITLGNGDNGLEQHLRKEFVCSEIVLAQLGNFCTVRKILGRFKLGV
ncbi:hypothetical protein HYZ70_03895 [Candidatus Curtissbacteria bacterium]|nr:hypothetical protein [Candidatus Curtissbacteria bacterium]